MSGTAGNLVDVVSKMRENKITDPIFKVHKQSIVMVVAKAKRWKAYGVSRISDAFLVDCADVIGVAAADLASRCSAGDIPVQWKGRRLHPLSKQGDQWEVESFRDVGIADGLGKCVTRVFRSEVFYPGLKRIRRPGMCGDFAGLGIDFAAQLVRSKLSCARKLGAFC